MPGESLPLHSLCNLVRVAAVAVPLSLFTGCAEKQIEHTVRKVPIENSSGENTAAESRAGAFATMKEKVEIELKAGLDKAVAELAAKQKAAWQKLDELKNASAESWERLEHGAKAAWEDLERAVKEAMKEPADERAAADQRDLGL